MTAHGVGQVLLNVLEPGIESGRFLREEQTQIVDVSQVRLLLLQTVASFRRRRLEVAPPASQ